ncbi:MAG: hypothetical protein ABRQ26_09025 [Syntrophomonadaceae bacterium]
MFKSFLIYGMCGWIAEILFTGAGSLWAGSASLTARTYLWMFPIYGLAVFLEPVHDQIRTSPWPVRGVIWTSIIIGIEYGTGWLLRSLIGVCPWDYSGHSRFAVDGLIRLDYFPVWFVAGLLFEKLHDFINHIQINVQ